MRLIETGRAQHGTTVLADVQTAGRGQRGRVWMGTAGASVLMSIILQPHYELPMQPLFLMEIAVAVAGVVQQACPDADVRIKWPNDIIVKDKKAGGILIENVVQGSKWRWTVAGIGLNVQQKVFGKDLPHATSLKAITGVDIGVMDLAVLLHERLLSAKAPEETLLHYNSLLYKQGALQLFRAASDTFLAEVIGVNRAGQLRLQLPDGSVQLYHHGTVEWVWS